MNNLLILLLVSCAYTVVDGDTSPPPPPTTTTTRPATTTTPHKTCECNFDTSDLCDWSAAHITNGWVWSYNFPTSMIETPGSRSPYVYINDTSAVFYYPYSDPSELTGVTPNTIFEFLLLHYTSNSSNQFQVIFEDSSRVEHVLITWNTVYSWSDIRLPCTGCCSTASPCSGRIILLTNVLEGTSLQVAIDGFKVYNADCNVPAEPTDHCECDFDTSGECEWSADFMTDGWVWSYDFPPNGIGIPPRSNGYIGAGYFYYIVDATGQLYYPATMSPIGLYDISVGTIFSFVYFMNATSGDENSFKFFFENQDGDKIQLYADYYGTLGEWNSVTVTLSALDSCGSIEPCYGRVWFETYNTPHQYLIVAVDSFYVDGASCDA